MVTVGDNLGVARYCHKLDVECVVILIACFGIHASGKEGVHVGGEGTGAVAVTVKLLECITEMFGGNYPTGFLHTSLAVVDVLDVELEPVGHTVSIINLAIPVLQAEDTPLEAVPYIQVLALA